MKKGITGVVLLFLLNISLSGQKSDFEKIFGDVHLKQLKGGLLGEVNFSDKANGKTIALYSSEKNCKWILEEMAYHNKLKNDYPGKFDVFVVFSDDTAAMSEYIQQVNFDFTYIYDPEMIISQKLFSKDTTYSVLFDSNGNTSEKTKSGKLNREAVLKQLDKHPPKPGAKQGTVFPLISFQIKRYELGDENSNNLTSINIPVKIMTGYKTKELTDTTENIKILTLSGKNILGLYSYAYDLPESRFIYNKELDYIGSHSPNHRYTVNLTVSDLHAGFNTMLIQQINLNFGLKASEIPQEREVLVLSATDTGKGKIQIVTTLNDDKTSLKKIGGDQFRLNKNDTTASKISELIEETARTNTEVRIISENQLQLRSKNITAAEIARCIEEATRMPVENRLDRGLRYSVEISAENPDKTLNSLLKLLSDNGLVIGKEKKEVKYMRISQADTNIR